MTAQSSFKLTYATMFNPPEELHTRFGEALAQVKARLGQEHAMLIDGKERFAAEKFEDRSPADTDRVLGVFQKGTAQDAGDCRGRRPPGFPRLEPHCPGRSGWPCCAKRPSSWTSASTRSGAVIALEVGKNRMEALGDVAETADLIRYACDQDGGQPRLHRRDGPRPAERLHTPPISRSCALTASGW